MRNKLRLYRISRIESKIPKAHLHIPRHCWLFAVGCAEENIPLVSVFFIRRQHETILV